MNEETNEHFSQTRLGWSGKPHESSLVLKEDTGEPVLFRTGDDKFKQMTDKRPDQKIEFDKVIIKKKDPNKVAAMKTLKESRQTQLDWLRKPDVLSEKGDLSPDQKLKSDELPKQTDIEDNKLKDHKDIDLEVCNGDQSCKEE